MSGQNALREGDVGFGTTCACGAPKHKASRTCQDCFRESRPTALATTGRHESIITFARGSEIRTLHCFGENGIGQIADGISRLPGDGWEVQVRSTPLSIFNDLRSDKLTDRGMSNRLSNLDRIA